MGERQFIHTIDSRRSLPSRSTCLCAKPKQLCLNRFWVCGITHIRIHIRNSWLFLTAVLNLYSRKIVGWTMAPDMHATLVGARSFVDGCCAALSLLLALSRILTGERSTLVTRSSAADEAWLKAPHELRRGLLG